MGYVRKMPEKYRKADMDVPATFVCPDKYAKMKVSLAPALETADVSGRIVRKRSRDGSDTSVKVEFTNATIEIRNYALLQLMLASPAFNRRPIGFSIDKTDPTGFWRSIGAIEERTVATSELIYDGSGELTIPAKGELNKVTKEFQGRKTEDGKPIEIAPLLVRD